MTFIKETYRLKPYTLDEDIQKLEAAAAVLHKRYNLTFRIIDMNFLSMWLRITVRQEPSLDLLDRRSVIAITREFILSVLPDVKVHVNSIGHKKKTR